ncbi:hypothetical protein [Actinomadura sp. DC4]|nr:hypothetical protein [Actinomadura sp. DC4]MDN3360024.1 hypothetical protein [Actinomadura sp. DC4]
MHAPDGNERAHAKINTMLIREELRKLKQASRIPDSRKDSDA